MATSPSARDRLTLKTVAIVQEEGCDGARPKSVGSGEVDMDVKDLHAACSATSCSASLRSNPSGVVLASSNLSVSTFDTYSGAGRIGFEA